jgi:protein-L-isoaspartate(D-aspartate) O-methyltransferase
MDMVHDQIEARGIRHPGVLRAMRDTPRHLFVPPDLRKHAYEDCPLAIGHGQSISQPYMVAAMTELLDPHATDRVLEIGTGSGYQAAVLSRLVRQVYTIEIIEPLASAARAVLTELGIRNITVRHGNGWQGWPELAPFDAIIVTSAPAHIPEILIEQLRAGGRFVAPVGVEAQELMLLEKDSAGQVRQRKVFPVMFVPMVGEPE